MLRIGICDDEELITKRLMRILYSLEKNQSENYDIEVYTDSVKLSEKLSAGKRYDLIFLDIMMPVKSGVEVGKIIRNDFQIISHRLFLYHLKINMQWICLK